MGVSSHVYEVVQPLTDASMQTVGEGLSSAVCILMCVSMSGHDADAETIPESWRASGGCVTKALGRCDDIPGLLCQVCLKSVEANGFGRCYFWDNEQRMMVSN